MIFRKAIAAVASMTLAAGMASYLPAGTESFDANAEASKYNYAEALQKSMFFYQVQQSGILPEWNEVSWRADSMINEAGEEVDVVPGGWFDAGDHLKFSLTNAYTASMLAWGIFEYEDAVKEAGLYEDYMNNLQWGLDFLVGCDLGDKVIGMIGDDAFDHVWYGSPEVYIRKYNLKNGVEERPYDEITAVTNVAMMSAALAGGYIAFKDYDAGLADTYLEHAVSLFNLASDTWEAKGDDANLDVGGQTPYYNVNHDTTTDNFVDDLFYAANFLYMATGEQSYLDLCEEKYIPICPKESQSTVNKYTWGHCWNNVLQGAALLYAINTGDQEWIDHVAHHLDYWDEGYGGKVVNKTPDGFPILDQWGSHRYATTTAWLAKLASDTIFKDDASLSEKYNTWAKTTLDYAFGDNDLGLSYVVGMGTNPINIHHRGASGIYDDHWNELGKTGDAKAEAEAQGWQTEYAHVLYGALEGGPNSDGSFKDDNGSYTNTEVAIDYNAGFTALLCAMVDDYGGEILEDFPPTEEPKWAEWEIAATLNGSGDSYSEIRVWAMNHTAWPARVAKDISFNYYFDVSELLAAGLSVDDISIKIGSQQYQEGQQGYATISGPYKYEADASGNTYYVEIQFEDGRAIMPTGQSEHRCEVQFRVSIPDAIDGQSTKGAWDPSNDYSYEYIPDAPNSLILDEALNDKITMYVDGALVWGTEPDGTTPGDVTPTEPDSGEATEPSQEDTTSAPEGIWGDANLNGDVEVADVITIMAHAANPEQYPITNETALYYADVYQHGDGIGINDAVSIQKFITKILAELPESSM